MLKSHFLENLAIDWMINKPLTPAKEKCDKPITDKYLTTWNSRRQNLNSARKKATLLPNKHTNVKAATCLHKMGEKNITIPSFFANLSEGNGVESVSRLLKHITYMRKKKRNRLVTCFPMFMQSCHSKKSSD